MSTQFTISRSLASHIVSTPVDEPKQELLQQRVPSLIAPAARFLALNTFREWSYDELAAVLDQLPQSPPTGIPQIVNRDRDKTCEDWISPPPDLVRRSALDQLALCINHKGEWALKEEGYVAMSHVWSQGLWADSKGRGLPRYAIDEIFERFVGHEVEWIWLDSLAIPNEDPDHPEYSKIKAMLINLMPEIYGEAAFVIVLDPLVMNLMSSDSLHIATAIFCGMWKTRVWTFQEAALTVDLRFVTGTGLVPAKHVLDDLGRRCGQDVTGDQYEPAFPVSDDARLCRHMWLNLWTLTYLYLHGLDIPGLMQHVYARDSTADLDYARAFAPVLRVRWDERWSREAGMDIFYRSQKSYSSRLVLMHGSPRLVNGPAWAPSYFTGLRGEKLEAGSIEWNKDGIIHSFYVYPITFIRQFPTVPHVSMEIGLANHDYKPLASVKCAWHPTENPDLLEAYGNAPPGTHCLLTDRPLQTFPGRFPFIGLCVSHLQDVKTRPLHFVPYFTVEIRSTEPSPVVPSRNPFPVLLRHRSPLLPPATPAPPKQLWFYHSLAYYHVTGFTPLHHAARRHSPEALRVLLFSGPDADRNRDAAVINRHDDVEHLNTPLHVATARNRPDNVRLLLQAGAKPDLVSSTKKTPLMIAAAAGYEGCVRVLVEMGADADKVAGSSPVLEALVGRRAGVLRYLLIDAVDGERRRKRLEVRDEGGWGVRKWAEWVDDAEVWAVLGEAGMGELSTEGEEASEGGEIDGTYKVTSEDVFF